jgi:hypothetical protein
MLPFVISLLFFDDLSSVSIDSTLAGQYFQEAEQLWRQDGGRLWGKRLNGPMLFVNPRDRFAVANQADAHGQLKKGNGVFTGKLPANVSLGNTSTPWAGVQWIMILWPLPKDRNARAVLLMHESWHRLQNDLGLPTQNPTISHLDTLEGRYWLQLEWRALTAALSKHNEPRLRVVEDALIFRRHRHRFFPTEAAKEKALEMNEGLAEYTGIKLSGMRPPDQIQFAIRKLEEGPSKVSTFIRWFAYWSGPAYGLLIDTQSREWLRQLKPTSDLGTLAERAFDLRLPEKNAENLEQRAAAYQAKELRAQEEAREKDRRDRVARAKAKFIDGPVLTLPLEKMQYSFEYSELLPLEPFGTVYPNLQLTDRWGTIVVKNGALFSSDYKSLRVSAPTLTKTPISGDGWSLTLKPGWKLVPAEAKGSYRVEKGS